MRRSANRIGTRSLLGFACLLAVSLASAVAPAGAAVVTDRPLLFSFNGSDTTAGDFVDPGKIAVDNTSGYVYVAEGENFAAKNAVSKFNPDGTAANFSATGTSSLFGTPGGGRFSLRSGVAVDNTGGPSQGRLYVTNLMSEKLIAFAPDGTVLWEADLGYRPEDVAVDSSGHPWVLNFDNGTVTEYANSGSPPAPISSFSASAGLPNSLEVDANGNVYTGGFTGVKKYVGGVFDSLLDPNGYDMFADQSSPSGHIFAIHYKSGDFSEYESNGALVGTFGAGLINAARGIGYSKALDRVYVANLSRATIEAFGPPATGTVPDPAIEATTIAGPGTATFHGTINPQSVANAYYFEWTDGSFGEGAAGRVFRSPPQSLPEDSSPHAVQLKATNLFGNTDWRVRLVTVNTASGLRTASGADTFKPPKATAGPTVTIAAPGPITTTTAHITGTVNPKEDSVYLQVEVSKGPDCVNATGGVNFEVHRSYIPGGEINTPIPVAEDLVGLLPGEHYCVRLRMNNSFDPDFNQGTLSEVKEFDTLPIPPSEVSTAFAAPRTDTSAQINGRVNPESGADFKYQFEWSEDGTNWIQLPLRESSANGTSPVVVADQLTGLKPDTTYHYRLALAENVSGPATSIGVEKTFRTRTSAEMVLPDRGVELVNNPDTGNQNVFREQGAQFPYLSADGSKALWAVAGGAPGSTGGTLAQFLAERTPSGWRSRTVAPPASQQIGESTKQYQLAAATPDLSHFVASVHPPFVLTPPKETTLARLDDHQAQEELKSYDWNGAGKEELGGIDMTSDGAHVLVVDTESKQLEDVGSGSPEIVSLMPDGTPSSCGLHTVANAGFISRGGGSAPQARHGYHWMATTDGSLVYFRAAPNGSCGAPLGLYVRDRATEETTLISLGEEGQSVEFIRASADGRRGEFTTVAQLDPADTNINTDLYQWDQDTKESSCLSCVVADASLEPGAPVLVSDDLSHAYFQSAKRLLPNLGTAGALNVYALSGGEIRFVGTGETSETLLNEKGAKLSADGNVLVFSSRPSRALTADEVQCASDCLQLYRYDYRDESLECISCLHGGVTTQMFGFGGTFDGEFDLSADGTTVGLVTKEDLVPLDVNRAYDDYEWRGGSLGLLTDGVSEPPIAFATLPAVWGMDADGSNILFAIAEPNLTPFAENRLQNLYDARIGGGFEPPSPPVHCSEDSCQGPLIPAPTVAPAGSSTFSGQGNEKGAPSRRACAKSKVRRHGRCVRKHKRHSRTTHANQGRSK